MICGRMGINFRILLTDEVLSNIFAHSLGNLSEISRTAHNAYRHPLNQIYPLSSQKKKDIFSPSIHLALNVARGINIYEMGDSIKKGPTSGDPDPIKKRHAT